MTGSDEEKCTAVDALAEGLVEGDEAVSAAERASARTRRSKRQRDAATEAPGERSEAAALSTDERSRGVAWANPNDPLEGLDDRIRAAGPGEAFASPVLDAALELQRDDGPAYQALRAKLAEALKSTGGSVSRWEVVLREHRAARKREAREAERARTEHARERKRAELEAQLVAQERVEVDEDDSFVRTGHGYTFSPAGIEWEMVDRRTGQTKVTRLANFVPLIVSQHVHHEAAGTTREYTLRVRVGEGAVRERSVTALEFVQPAWIENGLGLGAWLNPAERDAWKIAAQGVKLLCAGAPERHTYGLTGWHELPSRGWVYIDCGGGIGAEGRIADVRAVLRGQPRLKAYALPAPPEGPELGACVRELLALLALERPAVWVPLVALALRAVLGPSKAQVHLYGTTGVGKSEVCAVVQRFYGASFANGALPASWSDSAASLIGRRNVVSDALLVVDDAAPGDRRTTEKQQAAVDAIFRSGFNQEATGRSDRGGRARPEQSPRSAVLSTAEFRASQVASVSNRIVSLTLDARLPFDPRELATRAESHARGMAGYVRWLAPRMGELRANDGAALKALDARAAEHYRARESRLAEVMGPLRVGLETFFAFARELGALDETLVARALDALDAVASAQIARREGSNAGTVALDALRDAVYTGRAHITGSDGNAPERAGELGYRVDASGGWKPQGDRIGMVHPRSPNAVCLKTGPTHARLVEELRRRGAPELFRDDESLGRALHAAGLLVETEHRDGEGAYTARVSASGHRERWLVVPWAGLSTSALYVPSASGEVADTDESEGESW